MHILRAAAIVSSLFVSALLVGSTHAAARLDRYGDPLPRGAVMRLGTTRFRFDNHWLVRLAFLPDGKTLVGVGENSHLVFWDVASGRRTRRIELPNLYVASLALSPDGERLAVGGFWHPGAPATPEGSVRILETATGKEVCRWMREARGMDRCKLVFTPDGKRLIAYGNDGLLQVVDAASGGELQRQTFPADNSGSLTLSADGTQLALTSGPNTRKVFVWSWQAGEEPREIKLSLERPGFVSFSPAGTELAVGSDSSEPVILWNLKENRVVRRFSVPEARHYFRNAPVFTPDGKFLAISSQRSPDGGGIHVWNATTGAYVARVESDINLGEPVFAPDGRTFAAGCGSSLRLWEFPSLKELTPLGEGHRTSVSRIVRISDRLIATGSDDHSVRIWDLATTESKAMIAQGHWVRGLASSPDGSQLAMSSLDDTVRVVDLRDGKERFKLPGHGRTGGHRVLAFTPDGQRLLSFGDDFYLRIWNTRNGKAEKEHVIRPTGVNVPDPDGDPADRDRIFERGFLMGRADFTPDRRNMVLCIGTTLHLFDVESGKEVGSVTHKTVRIDNFAISSNGTQVLTAGMGMVALWDLAAMKMTQRIDLPDASWSPVTFAPDRKTFAITMRKPRRIAIYEVASGQERLRFENVPAQVTSLSYSDDGRQLYSGLQDGTVLVWDVTRAP